MFCDVTDPVGVAIGLFNTITFPPVTVEFLRNSTVTGGNVMVLNNPIATPTGSVTSQNIQDLDSWVKLKLGIYLGHVGETSDASGGGNPPTDAVDQDLVRIQLL